VQPRPATVPATVQNIRTGLQTPSGKEQNFLLSTFFTEAGEF